MGLYDRGQASFIHQGTGLLSDAEELREFILQYEFCSPDTLLIQLLQVIIAYSW